MRISRLFYLCYISVHHVFFCVITVKTLGAHYSVNNVVVVNGGDGDDKDDDDDDKDDICVMMMISC